MYRATPLTEKTALKELGERIRAHRIALNLSREAFAEKAGIGKNTLVRLEMGQSVSLSHAPRNAVRCWTRGHFRQ